MVPLLDTLDNGHRHHRKPGEAAAPVVGDKGEPLREWVVQAELRVILNQHGRERSVQKIAGRLATTTLRPRAHLGLFGRHIPALRWQESVRQWDLRQRVTTLTANHRREGKEQGQAVPDGVMNLGEHGRPVRWRQRKECDSPDRKTLVQRLHHLCLNPIVNGSLISKARQLANVIGAVHRAVPRLPHAVVHAAAEAVAGPHVPLQCVGHRRGIDRPLEVEQHVDGWLKHVHLRRPSSGLKSTPHGRHLPLDRSILAGTRLRITNFLPLHFRMGGVSSRTGSKKTNA
mmetsp:Transcript_75905/g.213807  ORF Transcript_75905/g.213807 Transcript_75905/m.213807 type:complete len:286 (+) Transcript_75905:572-1429(+)